MQVGIDIILVGDSLGNVVQGHETTLPVTVDDMIYHAKAVKRAVKNALIVVDMPFMSYQTSVDDAVRNCGRVMKEVGVGAVKLEGGAYIAEIVASPGGDRDPGDGASGSDPAGDQQVRDLRGARDGESGGGPARPRREGCCRRRGSSRSCWRRSRRALAKKVTAMLVPVPTIGIGAGPHCDGQVLVVYDMLGLTEEFKPRFVRRYGELADEMRGAFRELHQGRQRGQVPQR